MSISVNARAGALAAQFAARAEELRIEVAEGELGETLIDAGAHCVGGVSAGLRLAEICMGGLGDVALLPDAATPRYRSASRRPPASLTRRRSPSR